MFELGCHLIDRAVDLLGAPRKVTGILRHDSSYADKLADNTLAILEYDRAVAEIHVAAMQPHGDQYRTFEIFGANGAVTLRPFGGKLALDLVDALAGGSQFEVETFGPEAAGVEFVLLLVEGGELIAILFQQAVSLRLSLCQPVLRAPELILKQADMHFAFAQEVCGFGQVYKRRGLGKNRLGAKADEEVRVDGRAGAAIDAGVGRVEGIGHER